MTTIDADAHVIESDLTWQYMDESEQKFIPMVLEQMAGEERKSNRGAAQRQYFMFNSQVQPKDRNVDYEAMTSESREMADIKGRLKHMDELEIDIQVLYPTIFLAPCTRDAEGEFALYRSYNRWLASIWKVGGDRLRWAAMAPLYSMHKVRDELKFAKDHGACAIFVRPFECEKSLSDSYFFPFFETAAELDLAVTFHAGNGSFQNHSFLNGHNFAVFKLSMIGAFHSLLENEIPTRFPGVRWAFIEACSEWVPYALIDAEKRLKRTGRKLAENPLKDNNIYVTCEVTDNIAYVIDRVGDDNLIIGTDYGHTDTSAQIKALRILRGRGEIKPESIDKILGPNPARLYGLNGSS